MRVLDILSADRVSVANPAEGLVRSKSEALVRLATLLARGQDVLSADVIERVLHDRERLQSTGVGGGVAIPHGAIDRVERIIGAVLLCPDGIEFDAIDSAPVTILVAVIGPKRATGEHLKTLARVSRLLRDDSFRTRLLASTDGRSAFELIAHEESQTTQP